MIAKIASYGAAHPSDSEAIAVFKIIAEMEYQAS